MSEGKLLSDIVAFLQSKVTSGAVVEDEKESLELAIDCIKETFKVESTETSSNLLQIYEKGLGSNTGEPSTAPTGVAASTKEAQPEVSEATKAEADALKAKGNKLMASKEFSAAADAYTSAIDKNPTNPMYFSNRAAAYSQLSLHSKAAEDARRATELEPSYSKAWSRLGLALYALGDVKGSLEAYESGLKAEGDHQSEAMKKDYDNVKRRYDQEMAKSNDSVAKSASAGADSGADAGAGAGAPGGGGGFDFGNLAGLMNNPQIQQMAKSLMSDPNAMSNIMNSPMGQQLKSGKMPDMGQMMNDPAMQDMMKNFQK